MIKQNGSSMLELILALAVSLVIVTTIASVVTVSLRNSLFAKKQSEATRFAQEGMEWLRASKETDWDVFYGKSSAGGTSYCINSIPPPWPATGACTGTSFIANTIYFRELKMTNKDLIPAAPGNESVEAEVTVSWEDGKGRHTTSKLTTQFTDWK